jgi:hypothetical protein
MAGIPNKGLFKKGLYGTFKRALGWKRWIENKVCNEIKSDLRLTLRLCERFLVMSMAHIHIVPGKLSLDGHERDSVILRGVENINEMEMDEGERRGIDNRGGRKRVTPIKSDQELTGGYEG